MGSAGTSLAGYDMTIYGKDKVNQYFDFTTVDTEGYGSGACKGALTKYETEPVNDEIISFGKENGMDLEGYEKKTLEFYLDCYDDAFTSVGAKYYIWVEDFYDDKLFNDNCVDGIDTYGEKYRSYKINYNGEEKYVYQWITWVDGYDAGYYTARPTVSLLVPEGYDGIVAGFSAGDIDASGTYLWEAYVKDKFFLYRLD